MSSPGTASWHTSLMELAKIGRGRFQRIGKSRRDGQTLGLES